MRVAVIDRMAGAIPAEEIRRAIRAVNRQIADDFSPWWRCWGELRLEAVAAGPDEPPSNDALVDLRSDAVLHLWPGADAACALGHHFAARDPRPWGIVFPDLAAALGESWTVSLSREVLGMLVDPHANRLVTGPHPSVSNETVFHWFEPCDAVQSETYEIEDVSVANFVLPRYFTAGEELGGRNDFLARSTGGASLRSFGIAAGSWIGFYDPGKATYATYSHRGDERAAARLQAMAPFEKALRSTRHRLMTTGRSARVVLGARPSGRAARAARA